jgi:hypothetical protein
MRQRLHEIAERLRPAGVQEIETIVTPPYEARIEYTDREKGLAIIEADPPDTAEKLWARLHEYAHLVLEHWRDELYCRPYHVKEYECEIWTLNRFREEDILNDQLVDKSKEYVFDAIRWEVQSLEGKPYEGLSERALDYLTEEQRAEVLRIYNQWRDKFDYLQSMAFPYFYQGWVSPLT